MGCSSSQSKPGGFGGLGFKFRGLGFRVFSLGFGVWGLGLFQFRVWGLRFGVKGLGSRVGDSILSWAILTRAKYE